ncbi:MAG TPA: hypothetical protein VM204_07885, partial [Gaiellaceae bacterium]|nr:hypothetical protein [Gaiellaceae bacterium]
AAAAGGAVDHLEEPLAERPGVRGRLAGRYASAEADVTFARDGDGLTVRVAGESPAHARSLGERLFEVVDGPSRGSRFDFHPDAGEARWVRWASRLAERRPS